MTTSPTVIIRTMATSVSAYSMCIRWNVFKLLVEIHSEFNYYFLHLWTTLLSSSQGLVVATVVALVQPDDEQRYNESNSTSRVDYAKGDKEDW